MAEAAAAPVTAPAASEGSTEAAPVVAPVKPAPRRLPEPIKIKVRGKEELIDDLDQLTHWAQKGRGSHEAFEAASKKEAETSEKAKLFEAFKTNDPAAIRKALRDLGVDSKALRAASEQEIWEAMQEEALSPEQRRIRELEGEQAKTKAEREAAETKEKHTATEKQATALADQYAKLAMGALKEMGVSEGAAPPIVRRMSPYMLEALEQGLDTNSPQVARDIAAMAKEDIVSDINAVLSGATPEEVVALLGETISNKIRKHDLAKLSPRGVVPAQRPAQSATPKPGDPVKRRRSFWDEPAFGAKE